MIRNFKTWKCEMCSNVMRHEYNPSGKHHNCCVCDSNNWVEIIMDEKKKGV
jgi:hypothetical protein